VKRQKKHGKLAVPTAGFILLLVRREKVPCEFQFGWCQGNTIPYPPRKRRRIQSNNYGFIDLRGKPNAVESIPEVKDSPELANLLCLLASNESSLWSLGCDIGKHIDPDGWNVTGGYVQVIFKDYASKNYEDYEKLGKSMVSMIERESVSYFWKVEFFVSDVQLNLDEFNSETCSLHIWFYGKERTDQLARSSREKLIAIIANLLTTTT